MTLSTGQLPLFYTALCVYVVKHETIINISMPNMLHIGHVKYVNILVVFVGAKSSNHVSRLKPPEVNSCMSMPMKYIGIVHVKVRKIHHANF